MLFVHLHVFAKFCTDMLVVIDFHSGNQFPGAYTPGDTVLWWEYVQPKITCADHLHDQLSGQLFERECVTYAPTSFFQSPNTLFRRRDVFLTGTFVEGTSERQTEFFGIIPSEHSLES
jgi:hypothetical protein